MMGASKRIMEEFLFRETEKFNISMAGLQMWHSLMDLYYMVLIKEFKKNSHYLLQMMLKDIS